MGKQGKREKEKFREKRSEMPEGKEGRGWMRGGDARRQGGEQMEDRGVREREEEKKMNACGRTDVR